MSASVRCRLGTSTGVAAAAAAAAAGNGGGRSKTRRQQQQEPETTEEEDAEVGWGVALGGRWWGAEQTAQISPSSS